MWRAIFWSRSLEFLRSAIPPVQIRAVGIRNAQCLSAVWFCILRPKRQDESTRGLLVRWNCSKAQLSFIIPWRFSLAEDRGRYPGAYVLKKLGDDGKAADDDTGCKFGICPKAHLNHVVGYVWWCNYLPCVIRPQDGRNASAAKFISKVIERTGR